MRKLIIVNWIVLASLFAYLIRLSFGENNNGFFWRAMVFVIVFSMVVVLFTYKQLKIDAKSMATMLGVVNVFMFLFVVSATIPIDGIWCLSYGKPLINPHSCGGGVDYGSLWQGLFGSESKYVPDQLGLCEFSFNWNKDEGTCHRSTLGFYQYSSPNGKAFDYKTLILNLGWILFPIGTLFAYLHILKKEP